VRLGNPTGLAPATARARPRPPAPPRPARIKVVYDRDTNPLEGRLIENESLVWRQPVLLPTDIPGWNRPGAWPEAVSAPLDLVALAIGPAVSVRDLGSGDEFARFEVPDTWPTAVEFIPNSDLLAVGYEDGQVLLWPLWKPEQRPPTPAELDRLWADLAGTPAEAARANPVLLAHPRVALANLANRVYGLAAPSAEQIDRWLAQLSDPRFGVREQASRSLSLHLDLTEPAIREVLAVSRSPEVRQRLEAVLASRGQLETAGEVARLIRVVGILERIGTPEAGKLLVRVARGSGPSAKRAEDALVRLRDRAKASG